MHSPIYLDNNATTALAPEIADLMRELGLRGLANPASQHRQGRQALQHLEDARTQLLEMCHAPCSGMDTGQVVFTSGGTEANNLAILGHLTARSSQGPAGIVILGGTDHSSVLEAGQHASRLGCENRILPVDPLGQADLQRLDDWLQADASRIQLVSIMLGNNETGVIQDLAAISQLCQRHGVPLHSDIVQAIGKIPFDMQALGLSAISLTAHKIHGPVGIGALITRREFALEPILFGGGQQLGIRPGTEPVVPAMALAAAVKATICARESGEYTRLACARDEFEQRLAERSGATVIASEAPRLPHVSSLAFPGLDRQALHMALDLRGLACSTGSACASGSGRPSSVLRAMQLNSEVIASGIRFSFSKYTTDDELLRAADIISSVVEKQRTKQMA